MSGPSSFLFSLLSLLSSSRVVLSMMTVVACIASVVNDDSCGVHSKCNVVNDDSCGVHSRPYHSCVIACVMQVREEHAMGHDSGVCI